MSSVIGNIEQVRSKWGWFVALGVIVLLSGLYLWYYVGTATLVAVTVIGMLMLIAGVVEVVHAFSVPTWGRFILWLLAGIVYALGGLYVISNPVISSLPLTLVLGIALIAAGLLRLFFSFDLRPLTGWGWVAASGVVTAIVGVLVVSGWPESSLYTLGIFLAVDMILQGIAYIAVGFALKR